MRDGGCAAERRGRLARALAELDERLAELAAEAPAADGGQPQPPAPPPAPGVGEEGVDDAAAAELDAAKAPRADLSVVIGTSKLAEDPAMVERIMTMVNRAYYESLKELLHPSQKSYDRLSRREVVERLRMGDAGPRANRVLHIAYRGEALTPASVVGCMSSTFQPPWTDDGCGHWGLLVVDPDCQGQGIASVLIAAAERRLAGACHEIQIEYEYTPGHAYSERLEQWYEGRLGFRCVSGRARGGEAQFRKCRKPIPPQEAIRGQRERMAEIRAEVAQQLADAERECAELELQASG